MREVMFVSRVKQIINLDLKHLQAFHDIQNNEEIERFQKEEEIVVFIISQENNNINFLSHGNLLIFLF